MMEKNSIYTIGITVFVLVIIISLYTFYNRIRKLRDTQTEMQKHLMYQQGIIEKHNSVLQELNSNGAVQQSRLNVPDVIQNVVPPPPVVETQEEKPEQHEKRQSPNAMDSLLPMLSSVMGMMAQGGNESFMDTNDEEDDDEFEEEEEDDENSETKNKKKMEMVREIENELKELTDASPTEKEGRVDEGSVTEETITEKK